VHKRGWECWEVAASEKVISGTRDGKNSEEGIENEELFRTVRAGRLD
jgi:hypothetical protein